jgi:hypothetical protein
VGGMKFECVRELPTTTHSTAQQCANPSGKWLSPFSLQRTAHRSGCVLPFFLLLLFYRLFWFIT